MKYNSQARYKIYLKIQFAIYEIQQLMYTIQQPIYKIQVKI